MEETNLLSLVRLWLDTNCQITTKFATVSFCKKNATKPAPSLSKHLQLMNGSWNGWGCIRGRVVARRPWLFEVHYSIRCADYWWRHCTLLPNINGLYIPWIVICCTLRCIIVKTFPIKGPFHLANSLKCWQKVKTNFCTTVKMVGFKLDNSH
jgi:hypothetical protein